MESFILLFTNHPEKTFAYITLIITAICFFLIGASYYYDYIVKNNSCSILELLNTLNVTKEMVFRIVLWLAKYGYLQIENFNNEK